MSESFQEFMERALKAVLADDKTEIRKIREETMKYGNSLGEKIREAEHEHGIQPLQETKRVYAAICSLYEEALHTIGNVGDEASLDKRVDQATTMIIKFLYERGAVIVRHLDADHWVSVRSHRAEKGE